MAARPQIVGALMHEIECILNEYLSFNWDRLDDVLAANMHLLRADGLACPWKSAPSLEVRDVRQGCCSKTACSSLPSSWGFPLLPARRWWLLIVTSRPYC